jgi:hypothetical protein
VIVGVRECIHGLLNCGSFSCINYKSREVDVLFKNNDRRGYL